MFSVHLTLRDTGAGPPPCEAETNAVLDALWGCAGPGDGLEHVRAWTIPPGLDLVLFVRAPDRAEAELRAQCLLGRALSSGRADRFTLTLP